MDAKLSSINTIFAAALATSVPAKPMAKPTSAFFRAGASLVPSPVTATACPNYFRPVTKMYLSSGEERAKTFKFLAILSNSSIFDTFSIVPSPLLLTSFTKI
jgi:hypothetical protein